MARATVQISEKSRETLEELAAQSGQSMQAVLERLIEEEYRRRFFEAANAEYAALWQNPEAWAEYQAELTL